MRKKQISIIRVLLLYCTLLFLVSHQHAHAQFLYKASLHEIKETGFYRILVTPEIAAKSNPGLSDFRIFSEDGKPVPYILQKEQAFINQQALQVFPIISYNKTDSLSELIAENSTPANQTAEYSLVLEIVKANARRTARISGSNNQTEWFAIVDNVVIGKNDNSGSSENLEFISIPSGNYRYLKISILDKGLPPLNITRVGTLETRFIQGNYTALPAPVLSQTDSSKKSYISLQFNDSYPLAKLNLTIAGTELYKRSVYIYDTAGHLLAEATLTPTIDSVLLPGRKEKKIFLVIDNRDNEPLRVTTIRAWQLQQVAIASFAAGKNYYIETGNHTVAAPVYDLQYFSDRVSPFAEVIIPGPLTLQQQKEIEQSKQTVNKNWIWIFIIIALALLLLLSYRLLQNIATNKNDRS